MQCRRCGKDLGGAMRCSFCGYENSEGNVREMTRTERNFFNGVTIDADSANDDSRGKRNYEFRTRTTYVNFGGSNFFTRLVRAVLDGNILARVAATLIFVALVSLMLFVALPMLFVFLAAGIALLALAKILR